MSNLDRLRSRLTAHSLAALAVVALTLGWGQAAVWRELGEANESWRLARTLYRQAELGQRLEVADDAELRRMSGQILAMRDELDHP
ncbi:MAG: hypothetical protein AB1758_33825, partial [Candidatus Eremiobacterota bacterium]